MLAVPQMNSSSTEIKIPLLCGANLSFVTNMMQGCEKKHSKLMSSFVGLEVTLFNVLFQYRQFKKSHLFLVSVQSLVLIHLC